MTRRALAPVRTRAPGPARAPSSACSNPSSSATSSCTSGSAEATGSGVRAGLRRLRGCRFAGRSPGSWSPSGSPAVVETGYGGHEPVLLHDAPPSLAVGRLALLPFGQHRRRDEDRGIRTGCDPDQQREGEVLQRLAAEQQSAATPISVHMEVASDRVSTSLIERFTICEKAARGMRGAFSRIRSNTITTS